MENRQFQRSKMTKEKENSVNASVFGCELITIKNREKLAPELIPELIPECSKFSATTLPSLVRPRYSLI